jgi:hypothetical protein
MSSDTADHSSSQEVHGVNDLGGEDKTMILNSENRRHEPEVVADLWKWLRCPSVHKKHQGAAPCRHFCLEGFWHHHGPRWSFGTSPNQGEKRPPTRSCFLIGCQGGHFHVPRGRETYGSRIFLIFMQMVHFISAGR